MLTAMEGPRAVNLCSGEFKIFDEMINALDHSPEHVKNGTAKKQFRSRILR